MAGALVDVPDGEGILYVCEKGMSPRAGLVLAVLSLVVGLRGGAYLARAYDPACACVAGREREEAAEALRVPSVAPPTLRFGGPRLAVGIPVTVTAYSSTVDQTDSTPDVAAWGDNVWRLADANLPALALSRDLESMLPPGSKVYLVADRMSARWVRRVDLWMPTRGEAVRFGVRRAVLVVED